MLLGLIRPRFGLCSLLFTLIVPLDHTRVAHNAPTTAKPTPKDITPLDRMLDKVGNRDRAMGHTPGLGYKLVHTRFAYWLA